MKIIVLKLAVSDDNKADGIAEELFKDARDMYDGRAVVLNVAAVNPDKETLALYHERMGEDTPS